MMTELSEEKIEEYVTEIVDWKKDRDKEWEEIERTLQRLNDDLGDLWDEDREAFKYYAPILIQKAKDHIFNESTFKGIDAKHETPAEECRKKGLVYGNVQSGKIKLF